MKRSTVMGRCRYSRAVSYRWNDKPESAGTATMQELAEYYVKYSKTMGIVEYVQMKKLSARENEYMYQDSTIVYPKERRK